MPTTSAVLQEYVRQIPKHDAVTKAFAKRLFFADGTRPYPASYALLHILESKTDSRSYLPKEDFRHEKNLLCIEDAISLSVQRYTHNKLKARTVYEDFLAFVQSKHNVTISPAFPTIPASSDLERRLLITKMLQGKPKYGNQAQLAQDFGVSVRTISKDFDALSGGLADKHLCFLGHSLKINYEKVNGKYWTPSSLNPLFLALNLTQALTMLEGLRRMSSDKPFQQYAEVTAGIIWNQLSLYTQNRITEELSQKLDLDADWYNALEEVNVTSFMPENQFNKNIILDCLKNGKPVNVLVRSGNDGILPYENCCITDYCGHSLKLLLNDKSEIVISDEDVVNVLPGHW